MTTFARLQASGIVLPGALALAGLAVLVSLGAWQLERLAWKQDLIARTEARSQAAPELLPVPPDWARLDPDRYEYRAVELEGRFRHADEVHVYTALSSPRGAHGGPGWWVMTPLELDGGGTVFVNRGFVPESHKDAATRPEGQVTGDVEISGLVRMAEPQGPFIPDDEPDNNVWFTRDPARMAAALGLEGPVAPFFIDAREPAPGGLPQGGETVLTFRNDHLGYALTWFGLAATLVGVFGFWAYGRLSSVSQVPRSSALG
jgi:surfeit locus 1 family protein